MPELPDARPYLPAMGRDALLPLYDPLTRLLGASAAHRRLLGQAAIEPGHRVLEIGCGTGNLLLAAKQRHPGAEVVGLDPDPPALRRAARKAARSGLTVQLDRGYADELPYQDASIDRVLSAFMLHHLPPREKQAALHEIRRVLTPGGSLHLLDLIAPHDHGFLSRLRRHRAGVDCPQSAPGHLTDVGGTCICDLMAEAGLLGVREVGGGRTAFGRYACYRAKA
jgi:SAM-dependent methyltransferase